MIPRTAPLRPIPSRPTHLRATARTILAGAVMISLAAPAVAHAQTVPAASAPSVAPPALASADRVRLAEVRRLMHALADSVWPGWSGAPTAVLLVTPAREYLIWHPRPSAEFERVGYDSLLASDIHARPRQFSPTMLATFPAVGGVPTVVVGTAEQTGKRSTAWVLTVAHEHFHQMQTSRPDYYGRVAGLELSGGDQTGMWMLNYPFPYASPVVTAPFDALASRLRTALRDTASTNHARHAAAVDSARRALRSVLAPADHRYLDFQLWQEGIARYTELALARLAAARYTPSAAFAALPDAEPFAVVAGRLQREVLETERVSLTNQRVAFYPVGAALGLWLDRTDPSWRQRYFERLLTLEPPGQPPREESHRN